MSESQLSTPDYQSYVARELAEKLSDHKSLIFYLSLARKYPAAYLFRIAREVLDVPDEQIRKSRAALFTWLIKQEQKRVPENLPVTEDE